LALLDYDLGNVLFRIQNWRGDEVLLLLIEDYL
jgi:hypothetical protein